MTTVDRLSTSLKNPVFTFFRPAAPPRPGIGEAPDGHRTAADQPAPQLTGLDYDILEDLLLRCANGDREAFAEFHLLTSPNLELLTRSRHRSRVAADITLAETYAEVWRQASTFNYGSESSPWQWTLTILNQAEKSSGVELCQNPGDGWRAWLRPHVSFSPTKFGVETVLEGPWPRQR